MTSPANTRRSARTLVSVLLFGLVASGVTACTTPNCEMIDAPSASKTPIQVATVIAPTDNFVDFSTIVTAARAQMEDDLGANLPEEKLSDAIGGELSVTLADGVPQRVTRSTIDPIGTEAYDITSAIEATTGTLEQVASCAAGDFRTDGDNVPTQPESDILEALAVAADQFNNPEATHVLYVFSNGIQTFGEIQMQEPGYFPKSKKLAISLANNLKSLNKLPDLSGVKIYWYGMGQVDGTNQILSQQPRDGLATFWKQVIRNAGGTLEDSDVYGQVGSGLPHANAIHVTPIVVKTCKLFKLYEEQGIEFLANSASFVNPALAKKTAGSVAQGFVTCDEMTVSGFAAAGVDKSTYDSKKSTIDATNKSLTLARAKAFASLIRAAGYQGEISTEGAGTCGTEWKPNGKVDTAQQKLCRRVEVSN